MKVGHYIFVEPWQIWEPGDLAYCLVYSDGLRMHNHRGAKFDLVSERCIQPIQLKSGMLVELRHIEGHSPAFARSLGRQFTIKCYDRGEPWTARLEIKGAAPPDHFTNGYCFISRLRLIEETVTIPAGPHKCTCDNFVLCARGCQCGGI